MEWIPDAYQMKGYDSRSRRDRQSAAGVRGRDAHINCGAEGVLERAKSSLAEKVDTADIRFVQFADPNFYVRDNGPTVMAVSDERQNPDQPELSYYGTLPPDDPYCVQSRIAAVQMGCPWASSMVNSDVVSEGGSGVQRSGRHDDVHRGHGSAQT